MLGPVTVSAPHPGHYAASVSWGESEYRTMEIYDSRDARGSVTLTLAPSGDVQACMGRSESSSTSISHYASSSGKDEHSEDKTEELHGFGGRWTMRGSWLEVTLAGEDFKCPPGPQADVGTMKLVCAALAPAPGNTHLPKPILACRFDGPTGTARGWSLAVGPKSESWILLGEGNGLRAEWAKGGHDREPTLKLSVPPGPIGDDAWKKPF
jgi:hypothetical protein